MKAKKRISVRQQKIETFLVCCLGVIATVLLIVFWAWALYIANT